MIGLKLTLHAVLPLSYICIYYCRHFFCNLLWVLPTCVILYNFHTAKNIFHARVFATFYLIEMDSISHADSCLHYIYCDMHIVFKCVKPHLLKWKLQYIVRNCNYQLTLLGQILYKYLIQYSHLKLLHFPFAKCDVSNVFINWTLPGHVTGPLQTILWIHNPYTLLQRLVINH